MMSFYIKKYITYLTIFAESVALSLCKQHGSVFNKFRRFFSIRIVRSVGGTVNLIGSIDQDTDILIANHQSMADIFALEEVLGNDVRFIGRTGIMDKWPVSHIVNMVGHITVDQKDRRAIIKLLKDVKECKGKKVVIFPEGTRSQTGKIEPFEAGTKVLVEKLQLKAQPVVIKNILSVYNESAKTAKTGVIEIEALPAVSIEEGWYEKAHQDMSALFLAK
ncbi:lysophospholipid acyltransferase family protein [Litorilituus lipolyticus]|uniref:1-acyl-sn-glycerol-3-phosphate acyltransferase n=1 Tax=Litorilituus lipolyticus TaxID=2491017 RepID=A0A502L013_9GAMM|nr:1-acyl-sn-glycerol-3-phosphate acyltransferase [Litorilituus lipolyticus]TPH17310.1 1-acyl-sn-glycerol-3-phosphate acyltransferase [Litorilituus lipolyticus]